MIERKGVKSFIILALCLLCSAVVGSAAEQQGAKYVFLFIGDGMGLPQRGAANAYLQQEMSMGGLPAQGITTTYANNRFITGSAAAATAISTGHKTNINYIGVDPNFTPQKTIAEMAKEQGMKVGIVSSVSIDHATPAAFYAHVKDRSMYHEIDMALANSGFDYFGGGGLKDPEGKKSDNPQGNALDVAKQNGYSIVDNKKDFMAIKPGDGKIITWNSWLQDSQALPYAIDTTDKDVSLPEFTAKAVEMLDNDDKGFFLMVEGGKIDWACHANDAATAILDTQAFDECVKIALDFYKQHPDDTLIVVTGDHECGGLTLGFAGTKYASHFTILSGQKESFQKFVAQTLKDFMKSDGTYADMQQIITANFGLKFSGAEDDPTVLSKYEQKLLKEAYARSMGDQKIANDAEFDKKNHELSSINDREKGSVWEQDTENAYLAYGDYNPLAVTITHLLDEKAGIGWTSYEHTGVPVQTSAIGVDAEIFDGMYDNTDIFKKLAKTMKQQN